MDFPSKEELLANHFPEVDGMRQWLHAVRSLSVCPTFCMSGVFNVRRRLFQDTLAYLSPEGLMKAVETAKTSSATYCTACFTAKYPVPIGTVLPKSDSVQLIKPVSGDW